MIVIASISTIRLGWNSCANGTAMMPKVDETIAAQAMITADAPTWRQPTAKLRFLLIPRPIFLYFDGLIARTNGIGNKRLVGACQSYKRIGSMPAARRLKVYRTAIGFHDAYVAVPSKKAALAAWGASKDLFAIGGAEIVTDPALMKEALASPGEVVRRSRGSLADQLAALPEDRKKEEAAPRRESAKPARKPKPRPGRDKLDALEAELQRFDEEAAAQIAGIRDREEALRRERAGLEKQQRVAREALEAKLARAGERYEDALARWREEE